MTTREFAAKARQDETLSKQMAACKTLEEGYAAAKEAGLTDDQETFLTEMKAIQKQSLRELNDEELAAGELTEAELADIAGGTSPGEDSFAALAMYCLI